MVDFLPIPSSHLVSFTLLAFVLVISVIGENQGFVRTLDRKLLGLEKENLSHFRFYWHDIVSGPNPTSVPIVQPPSNKSTTAFGLMNLIDNPLTEGPKLSSKMVGKAQGFYASVAQKEIALLMAMNFAFIGGKYNESTISVLGRNAVFNKVREMPVIDGSGLFRFAKGYVKAKTYKLNLKTRDAIVEYNVYVLHY